MLDSVLEVSVKYRARSIIGCIFSGTAVSIGLAGFTLRLIIKHGGLCCDIVRIRAGAVKYTPDLGNICLLEGVLIDGQRIVVLVYADSD